MFTAVVAIIVPNWKQSNYPPRVEGDKSVEE
jgi:hypothetical protein